jgi:hypothetical protein
MQARYVVLVFALCAFPGLVEASVISVTVTLSKDTVNIGETATLTVFGQVKPAYAVAGNGIFGWDVDLRLSDPLVVELLPGTLDRTGWTRNALTSSSGMVKSWGLDAIYDTGEDNSNLGVGSAVRLFSVQFTGLALGNATFTVEPDTITGADFVTWFGNTGGDYSAASQVITVVPEPATLGLLGLGGLSLIIRCRRR